MVILRSDQFMSVKPLDGVLKDKVCHVAGYDELYYEIWDDRTIMPVIKRILKEQCLVMESRGI